MTGLAGSVRPNPTRPSYQETVLCFLCRCFPRVSPDIISGRRGLKTYSPPRKLRTSFVIIETYDDLAWKKIRIPAQVNEPFPCKYTFCELPENERQIQRRKEQVQCSILSPVRNPMLPLLPQHGYDYDYHDDYYYYYFFFFDDDDNNNYYYNYHNYSNLLPTTYYLLPTTYY